MPSGSPDNDYERARQARIAENNRKMQELGLHTAAQALQQTTLTSKPKPSQAPKRKQQFEIEVEVRRSGRLRGNQPESYAEDMMMLKMFQKIGIDRVDLLDAPRRRRINVDPVKLAALRITAAHKVGEEAPRGPFDSGKGVRIQGGRVYDSLYGVTCHWCRQKTLEEHVTCTHPDCGDGRKLPVSFCKACLRNRHGEDLAQAEASGCWVCPPCRGSCGDGCITCCNCGPCRKRSGLGATHQIVKEARGAGFSNVHDFLVHAKTGEGADEIAARKEAHTWGAWLKVPYEPAPSEDEQQGEECTTRAGTATSSQQQDSTASPAGASAAAAALLEPEEDEEEEEGQRRQPEFTAGRSTRSAAKLSQYFAVAKDSTSLAAKLGETKLSRKERMKRKLGLVSHT